MQGRYVWHQILQAVFAALLDLIDLSRYPPNRYIQLHPSLLRRDQMTETLNLNAIPTPYLLLRSEFL